MSPLWAMWLFSTGTLFFVEDGKVKRHEGFGGFTAALLDAIIKDMGAGFTWELVSLTTPKTSPRKLAAWMASAHKFIKGLNPTLVWVNKGISVLIIKDAEGNPVPWGMLKILGVSLSPKIMKRLAVLAWRSYLNGTFKTVIYTKPGRRIPPLVGVLSVCIYTSRKNEHLHDGVMAIRPSLVHAMIDKINTGVADKTEMVKEELRKSYRFNIRVILPAIPKEVVEMLYPIRTRNRARQKMWMDRRKAFVAEFGDGFMGKGDGLLGVEEKMWADLHIRIWTNGKPEVKSDTGFAYFQMFRQEQYGRVRTNPQMLAHFFSWLLDGHIQKAFKEQIDQMVWCLVKGILPDFIDPISREIGHNGDERNEDSINSFSYRYIKFARALPVWKSPGLLMAIYTMCENFLLPKGTKDRERRFPVPFSKSASLTSRAAAVDAGWKIPDLRFGEVFYHRVGMVVDDRVFAAVCFELGTADEDDHVYNNLRVAGNDKTVFLPVYTKGKHTRNIIVEPGTLVAVLVRPPTGHRTNGRAVGSEYFVLKVRGRVNDFNVFNIGGTQRFNGTWMSLVHKEVVPTIDLVDRPKMISEVELVEADGTPIEPTFKPVGLKVPKVYDFKFAWEQALVAPMASKAYGRHALLIMETWWTKIMTPYQADEGDFVDSAQQKPCVEDVASMTACNYDVADMILDAIENHGATVERVVAGDAEGGLFRMLGSIMGVGFEELPDFVARLMHCVVDGPFTKLIEFHKQEMTRFRQIATGHILQSAENARTAVADIEVTQTNKKGTPGLLVAMKKVESKFRDERRERFEAAGVKHSSDLSTAEYDEIGDRTVDWLLEFYTKHEVVRLMQEAYAYKMRAAGVGDAATINRTLSASDRDFMNGRMLDVLIAALKPLDWPGDEA